MNKAFDFLSQPEFLISTVLALLSIVITTVTYLFQRTKKKIRYELISDAPLLSHEDHFNDQVKISFKEEVLVDPHILTLTITNIGNVDLKPSDFVEPLRFEFECEKVYSADKLAGPPGRSIQFVPSNNCLEIPPFLLNSGDVILFKVILTKFKGKIKTVPQIAGVKNIPRVSRRIEPRPIFFRILLLLVSTSLILMLFNIITKNTFIYNNLLVIISLIILLNFVELIRSFILFFARR